MSRHEAYHSPKRPWINKRSDHFGKPAPEAYVIAYAVRHAGTAADKSLLMHGCSWGVLSDALIDAYPSIVAIDEDQEVMEAMKRSIQDKSWRSIEAMLVDYRSLPFQIDMFRTAICQRGALFDDQAIFAEAVRVVEDGGKIIGSAVGELDCLDVKKEVGRGSGFFGGTYLSSTKSRIFQMTYKERDAYILRIEDMAYADIFPDTNELALFLKAYGIIPDFGDQEGDAEALERYASAHVRDGGIEVMRHAIVYDIAVSKKR